MAPTPTRAMALRVNGAKYGLDQSNAVRLTAMVIASRVATRANASRSTIARRVRPFHIGTEMNTGTTCHIRTKQAIEADSTKDTSRLRRSRNTTHIRTISDRMAMRPMESA